MTGTSLGSHAAVRRRPAGRAPSRWSGAPRRPAGTTSGPATPTARRLHAARARRGVDGARCGSAPASSRRSRAGRRCSPSTPRRSPTPPARPLRARARLVLRRDRRALERHAVRAAAHARARDRRRAAPGPRRRARAGRLQARDAAAAPVPIYVAALRDRMLRARRRGRRRHVRELPPLSAGEHVVATIAPPPGHDVVCRFFCIPQPAEEALATRASCSPATRPCPSTRRSSARSAGARRSTRWSRPGAPATARRAVALAPRSCCARSSCSAGRGDARAAGRVRRRGGITSLCLMPICGPDELPELIDALAPRERHLVVGEDGRRAAAGARHARLRALPRRGVGPAGARRRRAVRAALPRGVPVRALVADDPAQARGVPRRVRGLRDRGGRALRRRATSSG